LCSFCLFVILVHLRPTRSTQILYTTLFRSVHLFQDEEDWRIKAQKLADKTYEFTQFLHDVLQIQDVGANFPEKVTYHCSCHMTRLLGVKEAPIKLLEQVQGLEFVELPNKEICCGFGGTFSVKMVPISEQMVDEKISHIEET